MQVGDPVRLKSGGPKMIVSNTDNYRYIGCTWFLPIPEVPGRWDGPFTARFKPDELVSVQELIPVDHGKVTSIADEKE